MAPAASICIPTLSRLRYLEEAVASARAQTRTDIEIVIGDDGDSPDIRAFCLATVAADPRVRYQKNPQRLGLAGNWNALAAAARGERLVLIGDDDRLLPAFVERLLAAARPETAVVFSNHHFIDAGGRRLEAETERLTRHYGRADLPAGPVARPSTFVWQNGLPMLASLVRTRDVQRLGFKPDINTPELELFVRLVHEGAELVYVPELLAECRVHAGTATSAGLTIERLVVYLQAIPAADDAQGAKAALLRSMMPSAVGRLLLAGDRDGARRLQQAPHYPAGWPSPTIVAQRLAVRLPAPLAARAYRLTSRIYHASKLAWRGAAQRLEGKAKPAAP
jgi:GT2 family glycosyltransferase